ncbi:putative phage abortive infection protein [Acinetobacter gerneri]|uniref:putative phage abortive infection protein n=1 Tax=Acinetobacter gerneri TaxID=202952 RepID=UPI003A890DCB
MQTKFKLAICKLFLFSLMITLIISVWNFLYSPYIDKYFSFDNGRMELIEKVNKSESTTEESSKIGDWGTFGDFIGGTLNPIISLISILLLFATWSLTAKTLNFTKKELENSNDLFKTQQFDAMFWGLIGNLENIEKSLYDKNEDGQVVLDLLYRNVFQNGIEKENIVQLKRNVILQNAELSKYFIYLYQILKNIDESLKSGSLEERFRLQKSYSNILRATLSTKVLQLLAINSCEEFDSYRGYLEKYNFFEHMPFYIVGFERALNVTLLFSLKSYSYDVYGNSKYYSEFVSKSNMNLIFENSEVNNLSSFLDIIFSKIDEKKICKVKVVDNPDYDYLEFYAKYDGELNIYEAKNRIIQFEEKGLFPKKNQILPKEKLDFVLTQIGVEFNLLDQTFIINPFDSQILFKKENPL